MPILWAAATPMALAVRQASIDISANVYILFVGSVVVNSNNNNSNNQISIAPYASYRGAMGVLLFKVMFQSRLHSSSCVVVDLRLKKPC